MGLRLPVIMGISFACLPTMQAIATDWITANPNKPAAAMAAILGAQLCGGIAAFLVGLFIKQVRRFFPMVLPNELNPPPAGEGKKEDYHNE